MCVCESVSSAKRSLRRTHMQDLKDYTQDVHYENYRKRKLMAGSPGPTSG